MNGHYFLLRIFKLFKIFVVPWKFGEGLLAIPETCTHVIIPSPILETCAT